MSSQKIFMSKYAVLQERNVFVWYPGVNGSIFFSWRVDEETPMTIKKMYRWMAIVLQLSQAMGCPLPQLTVFAAHIKPGCVFRYDVFQIGSALPHDSEDAVRPGHYCLYYKDKETEDWVYPAYVHRPLESYRLKESMPIFEPEMRVQTSLRDQALKRDGTACCFTSKGDDLQVLWIMPPQASWMFSLDRDERDRLSYDIEQDLSLCDPYRAIQNCLTMHKDMAELFRDNLISVDVDDNYRIVRFDKREGQSLQSNTQLILPDRPDRPSDEYLRIHLQWALHIHSGNGDMKFEHDQWSIEPFLEKCGLKPITTKPKYAGYWDTDLGKRIAEWTRDNPVEDDEEDK